jgi:hypothetical protein
MAQDLVHPTYRHLNRSIRLAGLPLKTWLAVSFAVVGTWATASVLPLPGSYAVSLSLTIFGAPLSVLLTTGEAVVSPRRVLHARLRARRLAGHYRASPPHHTHSERPGVLREPDASRPPRPRCGTPKPAKKATPV